MTSLNVAALRLQRQYCVPQGCLVGDDATSEHGRQVGCATACCWHVDMLAPPANLLCGIVMHSMTSERLASLMQLVS